MVSDMLTGDLVLLSAVEPKELAEAFARWNQDSEYQRFGMIEPANQLSVKKMTEWTERDQEKERPDFYFFGIRTLEGNRLVGTCGLGGDLFPHGEGFVGIGIGERELWSHGYGTDAMNLILRYAFLELNLRRVALSVSEFNPRAIQSYEKAGFIHEGRARGRIQRDGRHWDMIFMGILHEEWLDLSKHETKGDRD